MDDGCAPTAEVFACQMEFRHLGMFFQNRVNLLTQLSDALAVNDPHAQDSARLTLCQVIPYEVLHLARLKRVQIQHAINRHLNRLVVHEDI